MYVCVHARVFLCAHVTGKSTKTLLTECVKNAKLLHLAASLGPAGGPLRLALSLS